MRLNPSALGLQEEDNAQQVYRGLPTAVKARAAENIIALKSLQSLCGPILDPLLSPSSHVAGILKASYACHWSIQHTRFVCAKDKAVRTGSPLGEDPSLG